MGHGWRGFMWHLKKVLALGIQASNRSPLSLPGAELRANTSYAAAVVQDHRSEPNDLRLAAEVTQGSGDQANPHFPFLNLGNPSSANLDPQTQVSRNSCLGKEKDVISLQLPIAASDGTEEELFVDLQLRLMRGPLGTWEVSWSKVSEVASSINQPHKPKLPSSPTNTLKPKPPSTSQLYIAKPSFNSRPKSYQPITNLKPIPISNTKPKPTSKPKHTSISKPKPISFPKPKPISNPNSGNTSNAKPNIANPRPPNSKPNTLPIPNPKPKSHTWKPKPLRPNIYHSLTQHPASQASSSLPSSSSSYVLRNENSDAELSSTLKFPMSSD